MGVSAFAGMVNALDFSYGCATVRSPAPILVGAGPVASGTGVSLTISFARVETFDGIVFSPLNTNASINIGIGTTADLAVTPTAVSVSTPDIYNSGAITVTTSNGHGSGDPISSATYGLQEAINYLNGIGGGTVIVSAGWASAGGTAAMIAAAALPTNGTVSILDNRFGGGGGPSILTTLVPNASVLTLFSVGVTLLPAPGAGNMYDVIDCVIENKFLTGAYAAGGVIQLSYGTGVTVPASTTVAATFLTSPIASQMVKLTGALASSLSSVVLNKALFLNCATQDFTTGAGSLVVKTTYNRLSGF